MGCVGWVGEGCSSPASLPACASAPPAAGRLTNKQRKRTFTEEVMADPQLAEVGAWAVVGVAVVLVGVLLLPLVAVLLP